MDIRESDPALDFAAVAHRFAGVSDFPLRVGSLGAAIRGADAAALATFVRSGLRAAHVGAAGAREVMTALGPALEDPELDATRAVAALAARTAGDTATGRYLVPEGPGAIARQMVVRSVPDAKGGRPLTLGERRALARKRDPELIARALRDPDPMVTAVLLGNPAVREREVVEIAATRPVSGKILRTVYGSLRWAKHLPVLLALAKNPFCPVEVSVRIVPVLGMPDRRELIASPGLPGDVRAAAAWAPDD